MQKTMIRTIQPFLASVVILTLLLGWSPVSISGQVRDDDSYASFLLGIGNAEKAVTNQDVRAELKLARKLIEDARDALRHGRNDAAIKDFSRAQDVVRHIVDDPRDESADVQEKVAELLRTLEAFPGIGSEPGIRASTETAFGLHKTTFDTLQGAVTVNLPDDTSAGDTISGSVIAEPKGKTEAEKTTNQDQLNGLVVEIENQQTLPKENVARFVIPASASVIAVLLKNREGKEVARAQLPLIENPGQAKPAQPKSEYDNKQTAREEKSDLQPGGLSAVPALAQAGRPIAVKGNFDGDLASTLVKVGGKQIKPLAESPRQVIAICPADPIGKSDIEVFKHQKLVAKGSYRSVGIKLSAGKLNLLRGEQTTMTLTVTGVGDLDAPCSVRVVNATPWVISMSGGQAQIIAIRPSNVHAGIYTTTRALTGVQPGAFAINATLDNSGWRGPVIIHSSPATNTSSKPRRDIDPRESITSQARQPSDTGPRTESPDRYALPPCDSYLRALRQALHDLTFQIQVDPEVPEPGQIFTAQVIPATSNVRLLGNELSMSGPGGEALQAEIEVSWHVTTLGEIDLGPAVVATPDGPESMSSPSVRLAIAPYNVVDGGDRTIYRVPNMLLATVTLRSSCPETGIAASAGQPEAISFDPVTVRRRFDSSAPLEIPTILMLFRLRDFSTSSEFDSLGRVAAGLVVLPELQINQSLVNSYLDRLNDRLLRLSTLFPDNTLIRSTGAYRESLAIIRRAISDLSVPVAERDRLVFRIGDHNLEQLNFPFISSARHSLIDLINVNVEDEISSLIMIGCPGHRLDIFNAPEFNDREGLLSIMTTSASFSVRIPDLRVFDSRWADRNPDGATLAGGGIARIWHRPTPTLLRPGVRSFDHEISSLRMR